MVKANFMVRERFKIHIDPIVKTGISASQDFIVSISHIVLVDFSTCRIMSVFVVRYSRLLKQADLQHDVII